MAITTSEPTSYAVGVMTIPVEEHDPQFAAVVGRAVDALETMFRDGQVKLNMNLFELRGPHLSPQAGAYSPLDFLQIGFAEHIDRRFPFLLIVTEVDLSPTGKPYVLGLSSPLANIGIVSTKRLAPEFWGQPHNEDVRANRLANLMLHVLGHILGLSHSPDPANVMYDLHTAEDLDRMTGATGEQFQAMQKNLPLEARQDLATTGKALFAVRKIIQNRGSIWRAITRSNPLTLVPRLPAMIAAALSVIIILFFSPEMWDVASTVELYQLILFAIGSIVAATLVLYRAFSIGAISTRRGALTESSVVMRAATALSLLAAISVLYAAFLFLSYAGVVTIFPAKLMETWPTVDPAVRPLDHFKLGLFLAAMGVLTGSLGGRAEGKDLIRHILFFSEET